ncbi:MAG: nicotinate-nucleotide adenylyltransferase [Veillonellaceae bacterium]|nr:nicotinate-nucleotide adenylyltransferase [Veillonellaceae bacterium]
MGKRIGVFGGTFNPIHIGHLMIAEIATQTFGLDYTLFIPAHVPPHKACDIAPAEARYEMTRLAIADNDKFKISDIELRRDGPSYTVDTIHSLKKLYEAGTAFYFICGTDSIRDLPTWKYNKELLQEVYFIGATRPDGSAVIDDTIAYFGDLGRQKIYRLVVPELEVSGTDLRQRIRQGKTVRYIVPDLVIQYIEAHGLYR